jgi:hypothetical protein
VGARFQRGGRRFAADTVACFAADTVACFAAELRSASAKRAKPASEPGLVLQEMKAPSRSFAEGLFVGVDGSALGAAWVPFRVAKIEEAEVRVLFPECVRVDAQR